MAKRCGRAVRRVSQKVGLDLHLPPVHIERDPPSTAAPHPLVDTCRLMHRDAEGADALDEAHVESAAIDQQALFVWIVAPLRPVGPLHPHATHTRESAASIGS